MNKKETFEKIILGILTFILIMYISICLVFLAAFNVSKQFLNKENVEDFISNIDIIAVLKEEFDNDFNLYIIKDELISIGITEKGINEFINTEDVKKISSNTIKNIFNKISGNANINYKINENELYDLFENNIEELEIKSNIDESKVLSKIKNKIPDLTDNINDLLDKVLEKIENSKLFKQYHEYLFKSIGMLDLIYSDFTYFLIICVIVSFITLLIFIRRSFYKSLKWLTISFIVPMSILAIISTIIYNCININSMLVTNIFNVINKEMINYSITYFIISLIFVIINIVMYIIKKFKDKKVSYE